MAETHQDTRDVLLEAGLALASELSLPVVLQRIVDVATQVAQARYGALGVIGEDGNLVDFITSGISASRRRKIGALPSGKGLLGYVIKHAKAIRVREIGRHPKSVGFPPHHPPMRSFLGAPVMAMGKVYGNIYLADKRDAAEFSEADEQALAILAAQAGVAIANASLYGEMRLRERWLDALRTITGQLLAGASADSLLARIAEDARDLASAETATIASTTSDPEQLVVAAAAGPHSASLNGRLLPAEGSMSGRVLRTGTAVVLKDATRQREAHQPIIRAANVGPAIFVPLRVRDRATGTLMVGRRVGGQPFDQRTVRLVETFADQAAVAVEYSHAQMDQRRLGLMDERERIAKELHDGIIQSLFAVGMRLQATALMAGPVDISNRVEGAVEELDRVIRDLRNYIFGLRPGILADRHLDQALRELGADVQDRSNVEVTVEVDPEAAAALTAESNEIVQLTREALSNVARHAQARHAWVRLVRKGTGVMLTVEDDGVGFDATGESRGNGLRNMRDRAASLGGKMRIGGRKSRGTRMQVTIPA